MNEPSTMDTLLDALCASLEDEVERQQTALALCRAQAKALCAQDTEYLEAKTHALELVMAESEEASASRQVLLADIAGRCGLEEDWVNLSALIRCAPEPWRRRLAQCQREVQTVLREIRGVVRANAGLLRASMRVVEESMGALERSVHVNAAGYGSQGGSVRDVRVQPALIDRKG
ncbi:MAG TPA: flagellar protein FlgN [Candidatus Hydrogenedentes bacterium]|nr:flagellar protein FlgN [Candidatus Hydrogenedentota bacterium]